MLIFGALRTTWLASHPVVRRLFASVAAVIAASVLLSACISPSHPPFSETYSEPEARLLFEDAFSHIQQRYIDSVAIAPLAMNGMKALLGSQEPGDLQIEGEGEYVTLNRRGLQLAQFARPDPYDGNAWADVTAALLQKASDATPALHAMPAEDFYQAVMDGVVGKLDPFSRYASARAASNQRASREGFSGIGISIQTEAGLTHVVEVMLGTPAAEQGLQVGDLLTHADHQPLGGLDGNDVVDRLRGPTGSSVVLTLQRGVPAQVLDITLRRAFVVPATVVGTIDRTVAVLRISSFNRNTAADVERAYLQLATAPSPVRGLILDLRGNPGGLLDQAVLVADLFLDDGLVISTFGRHPASNSVFTADARQIAAGIPMAMLINGRSASASELLAAALQDRGRAVAIGTATHGKGSVQSLVRMPNGGELVLTWSRMHAPSGYVLDGLGVLPSICTASGDTQLSPAQVFASVDDYAMSVADWQRYDHVDRLRAAALRKSCPAGLDQRDEDMALAKRLLLDPALYVRALAPAVESAAARAVATPGAS